MTHHVHDLAVLLVREGKLESSFSGVDTDNTSPGFPIKAKKLVLDHPHGIEWVVQSPDGAGITRGQAVLDMVKRRVNKELGAGPASGAHVPSTRFDSDIVAYGAQLFELSVGDHNTILAKDGNLGTVRRPNDAFDFRGSDLSQDTATLDLKQDGPVFSAEQNPSRSPSFQKPVYIRNRRLDTLGGFVVQILNNNLALVPIQNGETISSKEDTRSEARASLSVRNGSAGVCQRKGDELIATTINVRAY
jgi:hypothetical protein